jgi:hypothetical protein
MKEKLLERLKLMDEAIMKQHQALQQANADLNMLNGCRQELVHIINLCDEPVPNECVVNDNIADENVTFDLIPEAEVIGEAV